MELIEALSQTSESAYVDFKSEFDPANKRAWMDLIKDVVAFANSGGGFILVGVLDNGTPSGYDVSALLAVDPADFGNKIHTFTETNLVQVKLHEAERSGERICAIEILSCAIPVVFTRVGEVELPEGKKKTIFAVGTLYFRHGAKSEPGTSEDLRAFLDRELERVRTTWLDGIKKVVEAPMGSKVAVIPPTNGQTTTALAENSIQLTNDPTAATLYAMPVDKTHPHRQKEVLLSLNSRFGGNAKINSHDLLAVRRAHDIEAKPSFCYRQNFASPRYSDVFVDWLAERFAEDSSFFQKARRRYESMQAAAKGV